MTPLAPKARIPLVLVLAVASHAIGAQPNDDLARDLDPKARVDVRARAAVRFGDTRATEHTSAVVAMLVAAAKMPRRVGDDTQRCLALVALDGLIRADARPTDAEALALAKLSALYAPGVARLLAADAKRYAPALAELIDRDRIHTALLKATCRDLLRLEDRRPLAASLLRRSMPHVTVGVQDAPASNLIVGGRFGSQSGRGRLNVPGDFPPFGFWTVGRKGPDGDALTIRTAVTRRAVEPGEAVGFGMTRSEMGAWLVRWNALSDLGIERPVIAAVRGDAQVRFVDAADYRERIAALRADYTARYYKLVDVARGKKLIDDAVAKTLVPRVTFDIRDRREDRTVPLPPTDDEPAPAKTVRIGGIEWHADYDRALAAARTTDRPLWLHFGENPG